jgi:hypothetical protein
MDRARLSPVWPARPAARLFFENDSEGSPDRLILAESFREFVCALGPIPVDDVSLGSSQVKSDWIYPDFAREHGLDIHPTGRAAPSHQMSMVKSSGTGSTASVD